SMDWVPRSVRSRARNIERAIGELEARLGRAPTDEEIAKKLGITEEELEESLGEIARSSIAALDELWTVSGSGGDQVAMIDTIEDESAPDPQGTLSVTEQKEALADAIARLPEREKLVVTLYYYEELTLREIGEVLGVTESRVSQLHTKAILRLLVSRLRVVDEDADPVAVPPAEPDDTSRVDVLPRDLELPARLPELWCQAEYVQPLRVAPRSQGSGEDYRAAVRAPEERAVGCSGRAGEREQQDDAEKSAHAPILGRGFCTFHPVDRHGRRDTMRLEATEEDTSRMPATEPTKIRNI